jgi:hypothetical protein
MHIPEIGCDLADRHVITRNRYRVPLPNAIQQAIAAVDLCFEKGLIAPSIDTMAWLGLPNDRQDVTGEDFVRWTEQYLLPSSSLPCTALDLYSSRCGILHSMTGESRAIRRGSASRIFFAWGGHRAEDLQRALDHIGEPVVAVQIEALVSAFKAAIERFVTATEQDSDLRRRVEARLDKVFAVMQAPTGMA